MTLRTHDPDQCVGEICCIHNPPPIWLLDVDGVINATKPGWSEAPFRDTATSDGREYVIRWAPSLMNRIRHLAATRAVEIRWCTTWCADAHELENIFKLPTLGRAFTQSVTTREEAKDAKLAAVNDALTTGRRVIWTDDIEVPLFGDLFAGFIDAGKLLLIAPNARQGISPEEMDVIEKFIAA